MRKLRIKKGNTEFPPIETYGEFTLQRNPTTNNIEVRLGNKYIGSFSTYKKAEVYIDRKFPQGDDDVDNGD